MGQCQQGLGVLWYWVYIQLCGTAFIYSTRSIVIDPVTPATLYAALEDAGVYRSTDSGAHWSAAATQPASLNLKALVIKPGSPATLYAATYGAGVFISNDSALN